MQHSGNTENKENYLTKYLWLSNYCLPNTCFMQCHPPQGSCRQPVPLHGYKNDKGNGFLKEEGKEQKIWLISIPTKASDSYILIYS